jgi:hypothetical protein
MEHLLHTQALIVVLPLVPPCLDGALPSEAHPYFPT